MREVREALAARRIVVKIGSSLLVEPDGRIRRRWLEALAGDLAGLRQQGSQVLVVTSGAIAIGRRLLRLNRAQLRLEEKQAAAAVGQIRLAHAYRESLAHFGLETAQILLTLEDTEARRRYLNARATIETLLRIGVVPVVNENDTVATSEIRFGDNDRLSARVAVMLSAGTLVLLSDVDGLYSADPRRHPEAQHIARVEAFTPELRAMAGDTLSETGTGGMRSKLEAAEIAVNAGTTVVLARGIDMHPLERILAGARCTLFPARTTPRRARKRWIAAHLEVRGALVVDPGAVAALRRGSSLLPAGVRRIEGNFEKGDAVAIRDPEGRVFAKGLVAYDAEDARRIAGRRTEDIEAVLGWRGRDELVHRDDLVLL